MKSRFQIFALVCMYMISGCKQDVKPEQLYGRWNYKEVVSPHQNPPLVMTKEEISVAKPYITFDSKGNVKIMWSGKTLSHGTYKLDGTMIRFKEVLEGGTIREFPFLIKELSPEKIVFQTMNEDPTLVTAMKEK